jgi:hypothetical protein
MEHFKPPAYVPNAEREFYSDAIIAMNAGKVLAALFYLRTFIEQFARRVTGKEQERATGDQIMSTYAETLAMQLRGEMPCHHLTSGTTS